LCNACASLGLFLLFVIVATDFVETGLDFVEDSLVGILEGLLEALVETSLSLGADSLLLAASLGSLGLDGGSAGGLADGKALLLGGFEGLGSGVNSLHSSLVGKRVLLASGGDFEVLALNTELGLDLIGVDDSGEVGAGHHVSSELESALGDTSGSVGTEDVVELSEGVLGEDDESSEVTTGSELEEVQSRDAANVDTGEVSSGALDGVVVVTVDDQGSLADGEATISNLAVASSGGLVVANAGKVAGNTEVVEGLEEGGGLLRVEVVNNKGELGHIVDLVASGHDKRTAGGGSEGGGNSVSLLVEVNLSVPFSLDRKRGEHATFTAHVTESTLTGTGSTRSRDSWDTGDGATSSP